MKKLFIFAFCFLLSATLFSLGKLRVEYIKLLPETNMSIKVRDADGKWAPALIVKTELRGLGFRNVSRPTKHAATYDEGKHQYTFYLNDNQRVIEITHSEYEPLEVRLLADFNIEVNAQRVYEMVLTNVPEKVFINVVIISQPADAEKIIDGENLGTGQTFKLFIGKHTLKVQKEHYRTEEKKINVTINNTFFNIELEEIDPVMITIKSNPTEASIFINDVDEGKTNKQLFRFPGDYNLRLVKNKCEKIDTTITVTETGDHIFSYNLEKSTVILTISVYPSDSDIYLNNEKLTSNTQEISLGKHKIEVRKTDYFSQSKTIDVQKGKDITESFTLIPKTGKLQFVVEPMEAQVTLKKGNSIVQTWNGSNYLSNLPIENYTITATCSGYKTDSKQVKIELDATARVDITLEKLPQSTYSGGSTEGMVFVQGGTFQMGSNDGLSNEQPIHTVIVSDFYIGKYEVTQKEWKEIMGNNPSHFKGDNLPVEKVSWYDAVEFCNKKSDREELTRCYTGSGLVIKCNFNANGYRLPTEAEWEYACRGGSRTALYEYSGSNNIGDVAWYDSNSGNKTHPVNKKKANELDIYDMSGNVWEWCNDWYNKKYYKSSPWNNPKGPSSGSRRVKRGGSVRSHSSSCFVEVRSSYFPLYTYGIIGFRLVRTVE